MPHTQPYLDDIVITGTTTEDHLKNLRDCFSRIHQAGVRLRRKKCRFLQYEIGHIGQIVDYYGVRVDPTKAAAIRAAPPSLDKEALKS